VPRTDMEASSDASHDGGGVLAPGPADAGHDGQPETDGGTACGALMQCCQYLAVAPPLAASCYLAAEVADGGNTGGCVSQLAVLQDAGVCP